MCYGLQGDLIKVEETLQDASPCPSIPLAAWSGTVHSASFGVHHLILLMCQPGPSCTEPVPVGKINAVCTQVHKTCIFVHLLHKQ